jgi:hypothetical protein
MKPRQTERIALTPKQKVPAEWQGLFVQGFSGGGESAYLPS